MGCPDIYYKQAIQDLAYLLACEEDLKLARKMYEEDSEEKLEQFILEQKSKISEKKFYYNAGISCQSVFYEADQEGCDALNASAAGIIEFEYFIGLKE